MLGLRTAADMRRRAAGCAALCRMLELMAFELERFRTPMPELMDMLAERTDRPASGLCRRCGTLLASGATMAGAWEESCAPLPERERAALLPLAGVLGRYGGEEELLALERTAREMDGLRGELIGRYREESRLALGLSAGMASLVAVLLL